MKKKIWVKFTEDSFLAFGSEGRKSVVDDDNLLTEERESTTIVCGSAGRAGEICGERKTFSLSPLFERFVDLRHPQSIDFAILRQFSYCSRHDEKRLCSMRSRKIEHPSNRAIQNKLVECLH